MRKLLTGSRRGPSLSQFVIRAIEELWPPLVYLAHGKKKLTEAADGSPAAERVVKSYGVLSNAQLEKRLEEEHERGRNVDEKTIRFAMTISIALTVLSSAAGVVLKSSEGGLGETAVSILFAISALYTLSAGLLALGALKTLPTYGFGTHYLIDKERPEAVARALVSQETVNIVRHLRNEATYQCLRNGFVLLLAALLLSVLLFGLRRHPDPEPASTRPTTARWVLQTEQVPSLARHSLARECFLPSASLAGRGSLAGDV